MSTITIKKHSRGEYSAIVWVGYEHNTQGAVVFRIDNDGLNHWTLSNHQGVELLDAHTKTELVNYLKTRNRERIAELANEVKSFYRA